MLEGHELAQETDREGLGAEQDQQSTEQQEGAVTDPLALNPAHRQVRADR